MKQLICSILMTLTALVAIAQMDAPLPGGNIRAAVSEDVGITDITIKYWRPGVKGRVGKIWGGVVANGFGTFSFITYKYTSPWRAGANNATVISFEHDVKVEGKVLKAGSYALFMAMGMDSVTLIFSKETEAWGSFYYREEDDVLRVKVKPVMLDKSVEWLKYEFIEHTEKSCVIAMQWEKVSVPFKVEVDVDNIVVARLRQEVTGPKGFMSHCLIQASSYCFDHDINLEEALVWAKGAITGIYGLTGYIALENLANGYEKLNRLPQADSSMNEALKFANVDQYINYGRILLTQKRIDRALYIMLAAKEKFGDVYEVNNNLSYDYSAKGDFNKALAFANKALVQASSPQKKSTVAANIEKLKAGKDIN